MCSRDRGIGILVPKLCLGTNAVKLGFIGEAELQKQGFPSWSLGARNRNVCQEYLHV